MLMQVSLKDGPARFSPQICYEGIDPEFTRAGANLGADFILNVTNDSWFGEDAEPYIHFMITAFRPIELRIPLVRATNTGFSGVVDVAGRIAVRSNLFKAENIETEFKFPSPEDRKKLPVFAEPTFYARHGEWFASLCVLLSLFMGLALFAPAFVIRLKDRKKIPR